MLASVVSLLWTCLSLLPIEILASFFEYILVPIQVHKPANIAAKAGMKAIIYLKAYASLAYCAIRMARIIPLDTLSRKEYIPYTKADEVLSLPMTSEMQLVEVLSRIAIPSP